MERPSRNARKEDIYNSYYAVHKRKKRNASEEPAIAPTPKRPNVNKKTRSKPKPRPDAAPSKASHRRRGRLLKGKGNGQQLDESDSPSPPSTPRDSPEPENHAAVAPNAVTVPQPSSPVPNVSLFLSAVPSTVVTEVHHSEEDVISTLNARYQQVTISTPALPSSTFPISNPSETSFDPILPYEDSLEFAGPSVASFEQHDVADPDSSSDEGSLRLANELPRETLRRTAHPGRPSNQRKKLLRQFGDRARKQVIEYGHGLGYSDEKLIMAVSGLGNPFRKPSRQGNAWNAYVALFDGAPATTRDQASFNKTVIRPAYEAKKAELGGEDSKEWHAFAQDLIKKHEALNQTAVQAFADSGSCQARIMSDVKRQLGEVATWCLMSGIHVMYVVVGDNVGSSAVHAQNVVATPSDELWKMVKELDLDAGRVFHYLMHKKEPLLTKKAMGSLEATRKGNQRAKNQTLMQSSTVRMKVLLNGCGIMKFANPGDSSSYLPWSQIPQLLASKHFRILNCPPVALAPRFGSFKLSKLKRAVLLVIWEALGAWVDASHVGSTDSSEQPIVHLVPWTQDEIASWGAARDDVPIMMDVAGQVIARVRDIPQINKEHAECDVASRVDSGNFQEPRASTSTSTLTSSSSASTSSLVERPAPALSVSAFQTSSSTPSFYPVADQYFAGVVPEFNFPVTDPNTVFSFVSSAPFS